MRGWLDSHLDQLKALWTAGTPVIEIAATLNRTKNAIIGAAHAMRLPPHPNGRVHSAAPAVTPTRKPALRAAPKRQRRVSQSAYLSSSAPVSPAGVQPVTLQGGRHVTLIDLEDFMCRRPFGDPQDKDYHYCGHDRRRDPQTGKPNSPYCEGHSSRGDGGCYRGAVAWERAWERK